MILITGATGFLGSNLAAALIDSGERPVLLKRAGSVLPPLLKAYEGRFEWREADLLDIFALEEALAGISFIYHCAAMVSFEPRDSGRMMHVNVEGTANLVNLALRLGVRRMLHVSSVAALGEGVQGRPVDETSLWEKSNSTSVYGMSKFESEREVWRAGVEGMEVNVICPSIILGEADWNHGSGLMFKMVRDGLSYYPPGSGGMVWVQDVVHAMLVIMASDIKQEKFLISAENISYKDFFSAVAARLDKPAPHFALKPWMLKIAWRFSRVLGISGFTRDTALAAIADSKYDASKISRMTGFTYTPLEEVISQICLRGDSATNQNP